MLKKDEKLSAFQIAVYHAFLLVRFQKQGQKAFFIAGDEAQFHGFSCTGT